MLFFAAIQATLLHSTPRTKHIFKIQNSRRGAKEAGKNGNGPETKTGKHDKCDDELEIFRQHKGNIHIHCVI